MNKEQLSRASDYRNLFVSNPMGRSVLRDLRNAFGGRLIDENPYIMASKVGANDVLKYIEERIGENVHNENT